MSRAKQAKGTRDGALRPLPKQVVTMSNNKKLSDDMGGYPVELARRLAIRHQQETILVEYALENTPYRENGRIGQVTIEGASVRDGIYNLLYLESSSKRNTYFAIYKCTKHTSSCNFECRIPKNPTVNPCPAIFFGEHQHQIWPNQYYDPNTGRLHQFERLLGIVLDLIKLGIEPATLFDDDLRATIDTFDDEINELLQLFNEYAEIFAEFEQSDHYVTGSAEDKYAVYCYFKARTTFESNLQQKVVDIVYGGMRTGDLGNRLSLIRANIMQCGEILHICGSLAFSGRELVTNVSQQTAWNVEDLFLGVFQGETNEHSARLMNKQIRNGKAHQIFDSREKEQMLAAFILLRALIVNKKSNVQRGSKKTEVKKVDSWFSADLTPRTNNQKNGPINEKKFELIKRAEQFARENWREYTVDAEEARFATLTAQNADQADRIKQLEAQLANFHLLKSSGDEAIKNKKRRLEP